MVISGVPLESARQTKLFCSFRWRLLVLIEVVLVVGEGGAALVFLQGLMCVGGGAAGAGIARPVAARCLFARQM